MSTHSITCYTQVDCAGSAESRIARSIGARDFPGRDHSTFNPVHEPCTGPLTLARAGGESAKQSRCIAPIPETQAGASLGATSPWREAMRVSQARFARVSSFERENAAETPRNRQQEFLVPQSPPVSRPLPIHSQPVSPVTQSIEHTSSGPRSNSWSPATNREAQFPQHFLGTSLPQKSPPPPWLRRVSAMATGPHARVADAGESRTQTSDTTGWDHDDRRHSRPRSAKRKRQGVTAVFTVSVTLTGPRSPPPALTAQH